MYLLATASLSSVLLVVDGVGTVVVAVSTLGVVLLTSDKAEAFDRLPRVASRLWWETTSDTLAPAGLTRPDPTCVGVGFCCRRLTESL